VHPSPPPRDPAPVGGVVADTDGAPAAEAAAGTGKAGVIEIVADTDGARAAREAVARSRSGPTAVWVGADDEPELDELRAEIGGRP